MLLSTPEKMTGADVNRLAAVLTDAYDAEAILRRATFGNRTVTTLCTLDSLAWKRRCAWSQLDAVVWG